MKNKNRGFTLIELLVVVAIIGILASVGVVAYNGYTASAKKAGVASNHANIMKTIGAELAKCGIDDHVFIVSDTKRLVCDPLGTVDEAARDYINGKTKEYKNPYGSGAVAVSTDPVKGESQIKIIPDGATFVTIRSCKTKDADDTACSEIIEGTVRIN